MSRYCFILFCTSSVVALVTGSYDQYSYKPSKYYHMPSYQTYDKRALKEYGSDQSYGSYGGYDSGYSTQNQGYTPHDVGNHGYGYQTRNTYVPESKYPSLKSGYDKYNQGQYQSTFDLGRSSYYKQGHGSASYNGDPYGQRKQYVYKPTAGYGINYKPLSYQLDLKPSYQSDYKPEYGPHQYDPCIELPEGDYALQAQFLDLFSGIDAQCNFVKCANSRAFVNPCSIGTKNDEYGGPHPKKGFCASLDYDHYCGYFPPQKEEEQYK